jgi:hypothetical protein
MLRTMSILLLPWLLQAAEPPQNSDLLIRVSGPVHVVDGEIVGTVIAANHDVVIDGTVAGHLVIINGTARITGNVRSGITAINATVSLEESAVVAEDVVLYRGRVEQVTGATVTGRIIHEQVPSFAQFAWMIWLAVTLVVLVGGLVFTWLAGGQLRSSVRLLTQKPGPVVITAIALVLGLPLAAFIAVLSGIGVPVGFVLMIFVLPVVAFVGYLISGTLLGSLLARRVPGLARNAYATAVVGLLALQLLVALPVAGVFIALLATQVGAGALAYRIWLQRQAIAAIA